MRHGPFLARLVFANEKACAIIYPSICLFVCMYVCKLCMYIEISMYVYMYVCVYVCPYVCMHKRSSGGSRIFCLGGLMGRGFFVWGGLRGIKRRRRETAIAEGKKRLPKKISDLCISQKIFFFSHRPFLCFNLLFVSVTARTKFWGG